jgi:hypothetical protein
LGTLDNQDEIDAKSYLSDKQSQNLKIQEIFYLKEKLLEDQNQLMFMKVTQN